MFEKEAEEWVKKEFPLLDMEHTNLEESITEYRAYKDGAEFGYNKANEWHKVADGDLPPTSGEMHAERYPILACTKNGYVTVAIRRKHGRAYEWFCYDYDGNTLYLDKEVIAWCEIPKYTEE